MNTKEIQKNRQEFIFECVSNALEGKAGSYDTIRRFRKIKDAFDDAENMSKCLNLLERGNLDEVCNHIINLQVHYGPDFMKLLEMSPAVVRWQWLVWLWYAGRTMGPHQTLWCMFHFIPLFVAARDDYGEAIRAVMKETQPMPSHRRTPFQAGIPFA